MAQKRMGSGGRGRKEREGKKRKEGKGKKEGREGKEGREDGGKERKGTVYIFTAP